MANQKLRKEKIILSTTPTTTTPSEQKRIQGFTRELGRILRTIADKIGNSKPEKKPVQKTTKEEPPANDQ